MWVYVIPFPFTLVMAYDEIATTISMTNIEELRVYVAQNEREEIRRRRYVREGLRALEVLLWLSPSHEQGKSVQVPCYPMAQEEKIQRTAVKGTFRINYRQPAKWRNLRNMNPGFLCSVLIPSRRSIAGLKIFRDTVISAEELGLTTDFRLTPKLYCPSMYWLQGTLL